MTAQTITAMFSDRYEADRAAAAIRENSALAASNVRVLPENSATGTVVAAEHREEGGFLNTLRNFFMPEEDRYGYAEGLRRGGFMVAVETDETHAHQVMDVLESAGAVDLDLEEAKWRSEGWRGYEPSSSATTNAPMTDTTGETAVPPMLGTMAPATASSGSTATTGIPTDVTAARPTTGTTGRAASAAGYGAPAGEGTEERIPLVEENLRVGKRQVIEGRVRIRSYVVETPVTESVQLRDEHVEVERRPVDRPLTGNEADPFREREIEAVETREEPVVSKDARVREELVMRKSVQEREEAVHDTVRRTEVRQDEGDVAVSDRDGAVSKPGVRP